MAQTFRLACASLLAATALTAAASAATINGVTATASSELTSPFDRTASHVVDGSGFSFATSTTSRTPDGTMWLTTGNGAAGGTPDTAPYMLFDLGAVYNVTSIVVWNYNEAYDGQTGFLNRGIASANVSYGTTSALGGSVGTFALNKGSGDTTTNYSTTISLPGVTARYLELSGFSHFAGSDNDFFGLSEVQFNGVAALAPTAVPEPASFALLGMSLIGAGFVRRYRQG